MCALRRAGADAFVAESPSELCDCGGIILPGVGAFGYAMRSLRDSGFDIAIKGAAKRGVPLLGICLGMQLMCMRSEEGNADCLGIFPTEVKRFIPQKHEDKVPHMGWNTLTNVKSGLFNERLENKFVYFVHSYYVPVNEYTAATTDYILPFSAALHKDNFYATQFHPEKSGSVGEVILKNFLKI